MLFLPYSSNSPDTHFLYYVIWLSRLNSKPECKFPGDVLLEEHHLSFRVAPNKIPSMYRVCLVKSSNAREWWFSGRITHKKVLQTLVQYFPGLLLCFFGFSWRPDSLSTSQHYDCPVLSTLLHFTKGQWWPGTPRVIPTNTLKSY